MPFSNGTRHQGRTIADYDRTLGLQSLSDTNGNTLQISSNGVVHSSGKALTFSRDAQGRVTQISDPRGDTLKIEFSILPTTMTWGNRTIYLRDPDGNLVSLFTHVAST